MTESRKIQEELSHYGLPEKAKWLENYVKHDIKSKGVGIPQIRQIVIRANKEYRLSESPVREQVVLLNDLMQQEFTEDKLAAIIYLQNFWRGKNDLEMLNLVTHWFEQRWITDWNVCDWLCVRLLSPVLDAFPKETLAKLREWRHCPNLWQARASLVPFAQAKSLAKYGDEIYACSAILIKREERFCKTAVGWVLREYSKIAPTLVRQFLHEHEAYLTREVVKNATKYFMP